MSEPRAARRSWIARALSLAGLRWHDLDWHVLAVAALLLALGLVFLSAMGEAEQAFGRHQIDFPAHVQKLLLTLPFLVIGLALRPRWLRRQAWVLYGLCVLLLLALFVIGDVRNGARRWIALPIGFDLQPSELAKVGLVLGLARALCRNRLRRARDWGPPLVLALVPIGLVALQPDLGTALTIVPVTLGMLYLAGARARVLGLFAVLALAVGAAAWQGEFGVRDYQRQRLDTWARSISAQELIAGRRGPAYHVYHARVAIGNGHLTGTGLGQGVANEAGHLPERDSDSVFAVVAEESGWIGATAILTLYALLIVLMMGSAAALRDRFARLAVGGIALCFAAHLFVNVGVNLGLLPLTGLTLPLFSTGGSSLLATFLSLGLALGLAAGREPTLDRDAFQAY